MRPDEFPGRRITFKVDEVDEQTGSSPLEMRLQGRRVEPAWIVQKLFKSHKGLRGVMACQRREPRNFRLTAKMCGFQVLGANRVEDAAKRQTKSLSRAKGLRRQFGPSLIEQPD